MYSHEELARLDKAYLWHPFTQMKDWLAEDITVIESGQGSFITDLQGRTYIDGVSSLWCNVHGHRKREIDDAIRAQLGRIAHSTFLGLSNVPAILLAEKLIGIAPRGLGKVFYSDSGSEAVEIALKMAFQYWRHRGRPEKRKFAKLVNAYHGDTIGAVSVGGIELFHQIYQPLLFKTFAAPSPYRYRWPGTSDPERVKRESLGAMEELLAKHGGEIAALVMEPVMQGAAGMIDQPDGYIAEARRLTREHDVLLVFDEVATGFGRTGTLFASDREKVTPDILTLAKGLTGGYLPLAATLTTDEIYGAFLGDYSEFKTFFHGHTYTGNPLAAAAALANLELFEKEKTLESLREKIAWLERRLGRLAAREHVGDVRQAGFMAGIELVKDRATKEEYPLAGKIGARVCRKAREFGIWIRPLGNVIVLMPPLAIEPGTLAELADGVERAIEAVTEQEAENKVWAKN
jgi:adenosylmethionine-8-amino-7-oxononanoate aminotransferase